MPMSKAFIYSALLHAVFLLAVYAVPLITDIFGVRPLPVEDMELIDVELADLTETPERRAPKPVPRPDPKPAAEMEPEPEPEPEDTQVAALPPQPKEVPEPPPPEPAPVEAGPPEVPPLPALPRAKPAPPPKEDEFESMLKDLAREFEDETQKTVEDKPEPEGDFLEDLAKALDTDETEPERPQTQKAPTLGNRLTLSEIDAVRRQIEPCWNVQIGARNPEELVVEVNMQMNRNGTVRQAYVVDRDRMSRDPHYRAAGESAMRAVLNKKCSPLKLPPDKYDRWKEITLTFDPSKMVGRQ